jgi:hypothetical protein
MLKLDLHGFKHEDVRREVIGFVESNWGSDKEVEIITGCSAKMRSIVIEVLKEYKLDHRIGGGFRLDRQSYIVTRFE